MTETTLSKIDDLVLAPKAIAGIVFWKHEERPQSSNWAFAAPLSIYGTFVDGMTLHGRAAGTDGWLHLSLVIMEIPVERVWYLPPRAHTNKSPSWAPQILGFPAFRVDRLFPHLISAPAFQVDGKSLLSIV